MQPKLPTSNLVWQPLGAQSLGQCDLGPLGQIALSAVLPLSLLPDQISLGKFVVVSISSILPTLLVSILSILPTLLVGILSILSTLLVGILSICQLCF